jgi:uncharacterized protein YecE (DUF72 family)
MPVHIGTSGWQYDHWRGRFYPRGVAAARWLEYYAERFSTVESNSAFYRLPLKRTFQSWAERTPDEFVMAVKVSRYLTHVKRLAGPAEPIERFLGRARGLGAKLGPILLQLPPTLRADPGKLRAVLDEVPDRVRIAVEPRHESWWTAEVRSILETRGAALCLADRGGPVTPLWSTAEWGYVRFHGGRGSPPSCYGEQALATWVDRIAQCWPRDREVFVYFNNDGWACALRDAVVFARLAARAGLRPTRVPTPDDVRVG